MKVIIAKNAGFCYGVTRAVRLCEEAAAAKKRCVTLGPIIHNTQEISRLRALGVGEISSAAEARYGDTVIIRSHGIGREEAEALIASGAEIIDATCPDVKRIHRIVSE
ncbi:MAG: bifunctional 4-hydroxy-3-methylbut-2-enyl diphosphate reductase/30S ribosomal protein S1, partial [Oscillospiraceae bacterium]|nr:bifunctional 4-hydroxy-3-methylbut-2-enyl diphosphate reductase/30S ribosomal protein S1 [Oscillospiraceae bacterium]